MSMFRDFGHENKHKRKKKRAQEQNKEMNDSCRMEWERNAFQECQGIVLGRKWKKGVNFIIGYIEKIKSYSTKKKE